MTIEPTHKLPVVNVPDQVDAKTTAGNYFVANYPPFSFWSPQQVDEAHKAFDRVPKPDTPLGLYVHIPFCRKRCHFCYFKVYTDRNAKQIHRYLDAVIHEVEQYAAKPFIDGRKPRFVYFGGGTPSYLSADQLDYLTNAIKAHLPWDEAEEITFECEPGTLNEKKLAAIRRMGVTRLSLGVENFDDHILELNNRAHRSKEVAAAYGYARSIGFPQINIDLIAGMLGETEDNWFNCVDRALELQPDCLTIYQMEIPFNTTIYQQMKTEGKSIAPVADWPTKRRWVSEAFSRLEAAGYTVSSAYTAVRNAANTRFVYRDALWNGADMLGVGVSSFSHIGGVHFQNQHNDEPYMLAVESGELPIFRAMAITDEERLVREFILQMKLGKLQIGRFQRKFGVDVRDRFAEPLARLQSQGYLAVRDDTIVYSRDGLLQVDRLLHEFFLPQHRGARYA